MKNILARTIALAFIMTFGTIANVSAALTVGVDTVPISLNRAYLNLVPSHIDVSNPEPIYLSFNFDKLGELFKIDSYSVTVKVGGITVSDESYSMFNVGGIWTTVGIDGLNSTTYMTGSMNTNSITIACGVRGSSVPYYLNNQGDTLEAAVSGYIQGQELPVTSFATVTYVPEPSALCIGALSAVILLKRRKR